MDVEVKFSFLKFYNFIKHVHKALPDTDYEITWFKRKSPKEYRQRFKRFFEWCDREGITHPKVRYPILFG